jgi:hypothetical protein
MKCCSALWAIPLIGAFALVARAAQPFVTDDPDPVPLHQLQLYTANTLTWSRESYSGSLPYMEFEYGVWDNLEIDLLVQGAFDQNLPEGSFHEGYGDTELSFKWQFVHADNSIVKGLEIATAPVFIIPTGNGHTGLGNGGGQEFLPIELEENWDNNQWCCYGGGGFAFNQGKGNDDYGFVGAVLQYQKTNSPLMIGAELFHFTPQAYNDGEHTGFNIGCSYNLSPEWAILASAGRDILGDDRLTIFLGVQLCYPP